MPSEASFWQQLRQRRTLVASDQCLLDLDERVQALEAQAGAQVQPSQAAAAPTRPRSTRSRLFRALVGPSEEPADILEEPAADLPAEPDVEVPQHVDPIPVTERLPELHELDRQGRCWAYRSTTHEPLGKAWVLGTPVSLQLTRPWCSFTHWLPHWALPMVADDSESSPT
jgi:hypothetical protein